MATPHLLDSDLSFTPADPGAPALPIERHIVAAALMAEHLRALASQMLMLLQHSPRDVATFDHLQNDLLATWTDLDDRYRAYHAVLTCEGQA